MKSENLKYFIGFDIGGTNIKYLLRQGNKILIYHSYKTNNIRGKQDLLNLFYSVIDPIILNYGKKNITGIGIGSKGRVTSEGVIVSSSLKLLSGLDLVSNLENKYSIKTKVVNDASLPYYAITENIKNKTILNVTLGTGIGTSLFLNYENLGGDYFSSKFARYEFRDSYIENYVSTDFLLNKIKENNLNINSTLELYDLASLGNKISKNIFKEYGENIGEVLSILLNKYHIDEIFFSGGIIKGKTFFFNHIKNSLEKYSNKKLPILKIFKEDYEIGCYGASNLFNFD
jgi:predicted NBD/HSP70 family sugar kinase